MKCAYKSASKVIIQEIMYFFTLELSAQKMKSFMLTSQILCLIGKDSQHQGPYTDGAQMNGVQPEEISRLREEIEELKSNRELLQSQLAEKDSLIENLVSECYKIEVKNNSHYPACFYF